MSRVIPVPNKPKKKAPPPPRPQIHIAFQQSPADEPEQERPQKLQPPLADQPEQVSPQEDSPLEVPKQQQIPLAQQEAVVEGEPQVIMVVPPIKKALPKKAIVPPNPKSKKPIPPPIKMDLPVRQAPLESATTEPSAKVEESIEIVQVKNEQAYQQMEVKVEAVQQKIETVMVQAEVEQQQSSPQPATIQKIDISLKPPAPPKPIRKGKTPPPPAKVVSRVPPPSHPANSIVEPKEEIASQPPTQPAAQQVQIKKEQANVQQKQQKVEEPVKVVGAPEQHTFQIKPIITPNTPALNPITKQTPLAAPSAPPKQVKNQQKQPPSIISANPAPVGKSSISAKLEELRRAKQQMLNDQSSEEEEEEIEDSENAQQIYQNRQDIVQERDIQEKPQEQAQKIEAIAPKESLPAEVRREQFPAEVKRELVPILETPIFDAPVKTVPIIPPKPPARTLAPPKRIAPPPTVKNVQKPVEIKVETPIPEQMIKQPAPLAQTQIKSIVQAPTAVEHIPKQKETGIVEVKPLLPVIPKVVAPVEKVKVKLSSKPQIESNQQMASLLQRYHTLKNGYLANLQQLDELIHFQRQQEDNEIDKINHLLADLHRRNVSIKQICSIKELPSPIQQEQVAI